MIRAMVARFLRGHRWPRMEIFSGLIGAILSLGALSAAMAALVFSAGCSRQANPLTPAQLAGLDTYWRLEAASEAFDRHDYATALREWRPLAEKGNVAAQSRLGDMYSSGIGVAEDRLEGFKWYRKAAAQGDVRARAFLDMIYSGGPLVPGNDTDAAKWFHSAADLGNVFAQYSLAVMYAKGQGVPQSYTEAAKWYRSAADQGHEDAQFNLGAMYRDGRGVARDYHEAVKWFQLAADQGQEFAQFNLALMYEAGQGVPQDFVKAHTLFNLAGARFTSADTNMSVASARDRDWVASKMTADQIAEAQRMARDWTPTPAHHVDQQPGGHP